MTDSEYEEYREGGLGVLAYFEEKKEAENTDEYDPAIEMYKKNMSKSRDELNEEYPDGEYGKSVDDISEDEILEYDNEDEYGTASAYPIRTLMTSDKTFSLGGQTKIIDRDTKEIVHIAKGKVFSLSSAWKIYNNDSEKVAISHVRKIFFSLVKKWKVTGDLGDFTIASKFWSWRRKYEISGGKFDGAILKGKFGNFSFDVIHNSEHILSAEKHLFSLTNKHSVEVFKKDLDIEHLATILMVAYLMDKKEEEDEMDDDY